MISPTRTHILALNKVTLRDAVGLKYHGCHKSEMGKTVIEN